MSNNNRLRIPILIYSSNAETPKCRYIKYDPLKSERSGLFYSHSNEVYLSVERVKSSFDNVSSWSSLIWTHNPVMSDNRKQMLIIRGQRSTGIISHRTKLLFSARPKSPHITVWLWLFLCFTQFDINRCSFWKEFCVLVGLKKQLRAQPPPLQTEPYL